MSICNALTSGIAKTCQNSAGGVQAVYVADFDTITAITVGTSSFSPNFDIITAITTSDQFYKIETNKNTSTMEEKTVINLDNSSTYHEITVKLILSRRDSEKRAFIDTLIAGQKSLALLVTDSNSVTWLVGKIEGAYVTEVMSASGQKKGDGNNYTITFLAQEPNQSYQVDDTIISSLI